MKSNEIRNLFTDFFQKKQHHIVSSAPMVIKNDPTLMFTNAGMNQFKDFFLGNRVSTHPRIANTQKCLRVSGKHNDLEEVGHDTYHHTMFEMLGNWSFGDYFKKEAIAWAWEFLTEACKIDKSRLYVTVFGGDNIEMLEKDNEAYTLWKDIVPENQIIYGSKKDNFWEMGDTGPCGPCSELHVDLRDDADRKVIQGRDLVNTDNPLVIEVWNLVFIEFNRKSDGKLEQLKAKHVDTGMGFERLCMVLQGKKSNYDTDVFTPLIQKIAELSKIKYGVHNKKDIAMRVIADHLRAVSFAIADGQLPSNIKAGYVIRRILRRAIRYNYVFLNIREPFIFRLVDTLSEQLSDAFPELKAQREFIKSIIQQEELSFLKTLSSGLIKFDNYLEQQTDKSIPIAGNFAFELYDTFGFPIDLTVLMAKETGKEVDLDGFEKCMAEQKARSKKATQQEVSDWFEVNLPVDTKFLGYESNKAEIKIIKFRKVSEKNEESYHLVFDRTPFYAESGGQVGDKGYIRNKEEQIPIENTFKENDLIIHKSNQLPKKIAESFTAVIDTERRFKIQSNHTATHLMHAALKKVLGHHVEQKGSLVDDTLLRFDFSHYSKVSDEEIKQVENLVNAKILENVALETFLDVPYEEAVKMGAIALFGEKYAENVRVVSFDKSFSIELCGGTHCKSTGQIGLFKIVSESAIAAGTRRIVAVTGSAALSFLENYQDMHKQLIEILKKPGDPIKSVISLIEENNLLKKEIEVYKNDKVQELKNGLIAEIKNVNGINFISKQVDMDMASIRNLALALKNESPDLFVLLASTSNNKANLSLLISEDLVKQKNLDAGKIIREIAKEINGSGGGQAFFATAGGTNINGIEKSFQKAKEYLEKL
ncbi:MAG: alanine--tRNA ligase [Bacteroidales bacterium]|nr:alanine--tRNA ligase [Bacteroidales bacterium]